MQGQMPTQLAPASGTTLTGEVGTIDSSLWSEQLQGPKKDSILKGIGITCLFSFFMMMVPMLMMGWAENSWDEAWRSEPLVIDWDESGLNGTFQISDTPIYDCSLAINEINDEDYYYYYDEDSFRVYDGCGDEGNLYQEKQITRVEFGEGLGKVTRVTFDNLTEGEAVLTVYPREYEQPNDSIEIHILDVVSLESQSFDANMTPLIFNVNTTNWDESCPAFTDLKIIEYGADSEHVEYTPTAQSPYSECHLTYSDYHYEFTVYATVDEKPFSSVTLFLPEQRSSNLDSQNFDANNTPLVFPVYTNEWQNYCAQEIRMSVTNRGTEWFYPDYQEWGSPPNCPDMVYRDHSQLNVGSIDYDSGYGEIFISEPLDNGTLLTAHYEIRSDDSFILDFGPCFGSLFSLVLFIVWIVQIVRNFQAGSTNKGTGMLVGIIPGVILSFISVLIIGLILFGF